MSDYIPPELIPNILARLPVDDVLRCTSVCKSWYELITSPSFASSHLNLSSPNQAPRMLCGLHYSKFGYTSYSVHRDNHTFDRVAEVDSPCPDYYSTVDCINGLFCFSSKKEGTIMLWNPSLRKSVILPKAGALPGPPPYYDFAVGFGFVAASNEYKLVSVCYNAVTQSVTAEIYGLSTGSWRDLNLEDYTNFESINPRQAHLNGILHWYKRSRIQGNPKYSSSILSFDLENEKFGALMVPSCLRHQGYFLLSTFSGSLCLMKDDKFCEIWVMKEYGVTDSWEKLFIIIDREPHGLTRYPKFRHNGELLFGQFHPDKMEYVSYTYNNKRVKNLGIFAHGLRYGHVLGAYPYLESLALLKSPDEVKIDEETSNISKNI